MDIGQSGITGLVAFLVGLGIPLALGAYVFYGQLITMDLLADLKDLPEYETPQGHQMLTEIYASNVIVLVLTGGLLLAGAYALGAGLVAISSGSMYLSYK